jgi:hypothetical protein
VLELLLVVAGLLPPAAVDVPPPLFELEHAETAIADAASTAIEAVNRCITSYLHSRGSGL